MLRPGPEWTLARPEKRQGDLSVELGVSSLPDLAHAALAEEGGNLIVPEAGAGAEGHALFGLQGHSTPRPSQVPGGAQNYPCAALTRAPRRHPGIATATELGCEDDLAKVPCNNAGHYFDVLSVSPRNRC